MEISEERLKEIKNRLAMSAMDLGFTSDGSKFEKDLKRYNCTLGHSSGWCDGKNAVHCPQRLNEPDRKTGGCFIAI
ncbi:MAG TPA: hypothetical protein ENH82_04195 [bacterium]|nr:hypothetical protein [bacterium]